MVTQSDWWCRHIMSLTVFLTPEGIGGLSRGHGRWAFNFRKIKAMPPEQKKAWVRVHYLK